MEQREAQSAGFSPINSPSPHRRSRGVIFKKSLCLSFNSRDVCKGWGEGGGNSPKYSLELALPPSGPIPKQMVLGEQKKKDGTPGSRTIGLGWGTRYGLNKAKNTKMKPSHLLLQAGSEDLSYIFYRSTRKD